MRYPSLHAVAGERLFADICRSVAEYDLLRVDEDLRVLRRLIPDQDLKRHYARRLSEEGIPLIAELFAVARAVAHATRVHPHHPGRGKRNYDARIEFEDGAVALEVKHQKDTFPFADETFGDGPVTMHSGVRPGADPKISGESLPVGATRTVPGSKIWRDAIIEAAGQLPVGETGIVALSVDAFGDFEIDVVNALMGDRYVSAVQFDDGSIETREKRFGNGAFELDSFVHVSAVWFFKLKPVCIDSSADTLKTLCVWARGTTNHRAKRRSIPEGLASSLLQVYEEPPAVPDTTDE